MRVGQVPVQQGLHDQSDFPQYMACFDQSVRFCGIFQWQSRRNEWPEFPAGDQFCAVCENIALMLARQWQVLQHWCQHERETDAEIPFAGMIVCPIFANEGLPNIPDGYMQKAVSAVRDAGGLYIADEVQSGFGRTGQWWGHAASGVIPDILTLGKPMGAGHPISGVIARGELIDNYRRSEMYFNTFGGNPVS